ncbi:DEAD/DEAH box helicase [Candidatus Woesearchaeota archaeon CG08_land_8_20_14_0_20_47_9]|nr:MAG: hypothetical protein AUJ69_00300 [Candidatus Woesearchaeota archaeon CG1_02_47_18]PIO04129.1 MAG: DEAD/DEAH box helicase [Candidatus Woesearchaeota archaeon CG08_land_8_20_14_0_20_47_9]HII29923.1 DEAD/DEAH box helicase [Candidatus Woesearchaeota archaeon]
MNLRDFSPRLYQETIFATAATKNTLVVLPTGLGKTAIAMMLAAHRLSQHNTSKAVVLAPTRPLCQQHLDTFTRHLVLEPERIVLMTGKTPPEKRSALWADARVVISTPQTIENDVINNRAPLRDVSLVVFDEAHRAVKDYAYVWIAKQYYRQASYPRILALTASPGSDLDTIRDVCANLSIEDIEVRTQNDPDVKPYVKEIRIEWFKLSLPEEFIRIRRFLDKSFNEKLAEAKKRLDLPNINPSMSKKDLLALQASLQADIAQGVKNFDMLKALSLLAEAMKVQHAIELLETQGISALKKYLDKLCSDAAARLTKAVANLMLDPNFKSAMALTDDLFSSGEEHPKIAVLRQIVADNIKTSGKIIIFNQYRDSATKLRSELGNIPGVSARVFVGQAKKIDTGLSQREQKAMMDDFREGRFNVLISTSIGEEGLDVPNVNLVVFYEPIPSAIRQIQRRGRTGRHREGRVIILVTQNTRDEAYMWTAHHKEQRMYRSIKRLKWELKSSTPKKEEKKEEPKHGQLSLGDFKGNPGADNPGRAGHIDEADRGVTASYTSFSADSKVTIKGKTLIFIDSRERNSAVVKELIELGASVRVERLDVADYLVSERVGIEFKTAEDFANSIIDGRLMSQASSLKTQFLQPVMIIEGSSDQLYTARNIHPNAMRGAIASIAVSYGIPILYSKNYRETASLIFAIAKKEQKDYSAPKLHSLKDQNPLSRVQEYIVSALPGVGSILARPLLEHFGSVSRVMNASEYELREVNLIGEKKARAIRQAIDGEYG